MKKVKEEFYEEFIKTAGFLLESSSYFSGLSNYFDKINYQLYVDNNSLVLFIDHKEAGRTIIQDDIYIVAAQLMISTYKRYVHFKSQELRWQEIWDMCE